MTTAIDLFAGLGGWSTGARAAGVQVLWAANHWPESSLVLPTLAEPKRTAADGVDTTAFFLFLRAFEEDL